MRGDEMPVVINKPLGRRDVKKTFVIKESPRRALSNEFIPVPAEIYHEGYVGGKRFVVPDSNLDAMATLMNLKMRRRISIRYKHQTSFDIADDNSIMKKLNRLAKKIDSIYISDDNDDGSEGFDHLKMSVSKPNEKGREDEESLSELQVEVVRSYELLNNDDGMSLFNVTDKKMSTSYLCEEMPGKLVNNGVYVTRKNSKVYKKKELIDGDINMEANLICEKDTGTQATPIPCNFPDILQPEELEKNYSITPQRKEVYTSIRASSSNENKAADYNTMSFDNCNDLFWLSKKKENKETDSIIEPLFSNTNHSRLFRANEDGKIYSMSQNDKIHCNSTRGNDKTDYLLKKLSSDFNPSEIVSQVNKGDKKKSISQQNRKEGWRKRMNFERIVISQANVTNNSDSALVAENKKRGDCYSQQLTPLKIIKGIDLTTHKNTVVCRKSSIGQHKKLNCKDVESKDCNSSQIYKSRRNKCVDYKSQKNKGLNHDFKTLSKQKDDKTCAKNKMQPLNIELDVEADDYYNSRFYNLVKMQRDRRSLQSRCLGEGGDCSLKRQVVYIEVKAEDSYRAIHNVEVRQRDRTCLQSK